MNAKFIQIAAIAAALTLSVSGIKAETTDSAASKGPMLQIEAVRDHRPLGRIVLAFATDGGMQGTEETNPATRYSELPSELRPKAFGDAPVVVGFKWKTVLKGNGMMSVAVSWLEQIGTVVVSGKAYPVLNGSSFEGDFAPSRGDVVNGFAIGQLRFRLLPAAAAK
jgi:hypothetical protein